jgi:translation initiation factor 4G
VQLDRPDIFAFPQQQPLHTHRKTKDTAFESPVPSMTSTASQQNQNPAQTPAAPVATPSYASAAGANKKPTSSPRPVAGSQPPVVVGTSAPAAQNGKPSAAAPMNGRPNIPPAVPTVATPPVARGSSIVNGGADHARKSSVTISANAPASHIANGGPAGGPKGIQFGFNESPAIAHSTPQAGGPAPIPIPGSGNPRIQSPAHSPSPIPQMPQQSGGGQRAPTVPQAPVTFGSFPGDNDVRILGLRCRQPLFTNPLSEASYEATQRSRDGPEPSR